MRTWNDDAMEPALSETAKTVSVSKPTRRAGKSRFDAGVYAFHRGEYSRALIDFEKSCEIFIARSAHAEFIESCTYVLRILAEREEFSKINRIEQRVFQMISSLGPDQLPAKLKSRAVYVLGICSCYQEKKHAQAMLRFRDAIDHAVDAEDKEALASALYGTATTFYAQGKVEDALRELDRLSILLSCLNIPDLVSAAALLTSMIRRNQGSVDAALEAAWRAFDSLKNHPNVLLYLHTLCVLGNLYHAKGDEGSARLYLDLANRTLRREEFPRITRLIDEAMASLEKARTACPDLLFDGRTGVLVEKNIGEIRFEGQFVLRDLLRIFLEKPGHVFNKEDLARLVWRESYEPRIHDNKIYVTIKRLRKLFERDGTTAPAVEYILRAKNGYFLNPKVQVQILDHALENIS